MVLYCTADYFRQVRNEPQVNNRLFVQEVPAQKFRVIQGLPPR